MTIIDYDIVKDIDILFEKRIVIYGAGNDGKEMFLLLQSAGIEVVCFCDKDKEKREYLECEVISLEMLKEKVKREEWLVIVASRKYREEIIKNIEIAKIEANVCTNTAVSLAFDFHIEHSKNFSKDFVNAYLEEWDAYVLNRKLQLSVRRFEKINQIPIPILVYQPGKVGSSSISHSLNAYGIENVQVHCLVNFVAWKELSLENSFLENMKKQGDYLKQHIRSNGCKIITLVRDPIDRAISGYMQRSSDRMLGKNFFNDFEKNFQKLICEVVESNQEFKWFDEEIKELTGIDVYEYPFDIKKGYTIIKENNIEILVLTLEKLNDNEEIIGEFVSIPDFKIQNSNVGERKGTKYIYQSVKEHIRFPLELIEQQYLHNEKMNHFYLEEERRGFMKKWENNIDGE